jgi:hypothetical protein
MFHLRDIELIIHRSHHFIAMEEIDIKISDEFLFTQIVLSP